MGATTPDRTGPSASGPCAGTSIVDDLRRGIAPISRAAWAQIDENAARVLRLDLAARKVVDFCGPLGWGASSIPLGRIERLGPQPAADVSAAIRRVQPLV